MSYKIMIQHRNVYLVEIFKAGLAKQQYHPVKFGALTTMTPVAQTNLPNTSPVFAQFFPFQNCAHSAFSKGSAF